MNLLNGKAVFFSYLRLGQHVGKINIHSFNSNLLGNITLSAGVVYVLRPKYEVVNQKSKAEANTSIIKVIRIHCLGTMNVFMCQLIQ